MKNQVSGCLFGTAFGDALGAETEFLSVAQILAQWPPDGPQEPRASWRVTDDTQMMLAVGEALFQAPRPYTAATLEGPLRDAFIRWADSPDNDQAPGITCLTSCAALKLGMPWTEATRPNSKGCGANMRVQPVGVLPGLPAETQAAIAQFQAALTHGHPTALAASDLTATTIARLRSGVAPRDLPAMLREYVHSQRRVYHEDWLGTLWQRPIRERPVMDTPEQFIMYGWDECLGSLDALDLALRAENRTEDPCRVTGEGWVAEEAFATGLLCFLLLPDAPQDALRRAAVSSGDSDSIACLTGAFAGAYHGMSAWPKDWAARIEYKDRLAALGSAWD